MPNEENIKKESELLPSPYVSVRTISQFKGSPNELVLNCDTNAEIVLGAAPQNTPEIAKALYNSNITMVAGRGTAIKNYPAPSNKIVPFSNKFYYDSAVIQISEQTNVDDNFGSKNRDPKSQNSSAIALKADEIRLFSRGSIKIVTGIDQMEKDQIVKNDPNAPTHPKRDFSGISLIAGNSSENDGDLQPLVLGNNLVEFLNEVLDEMKRTYATIYQAFQYQVAINDAIMKHTHLCNFTLNPLTPMTDPVLNGIIVQKNIDITKLTGLDVETKRITNINTLKSNYLEQNPSKYINSYYNKTN